MTECSSGSVDALNLEANEITGMNDDVLRTFVDRRQVNHLVKSGANWIPATLENHEDYGDRSNFFLGFSLSHIGFQSGTVTSPNSNVPFMFDGVLDRPPGVDCAKGIHDTPVFDSNVIIMFLFDCSIMIQVVADSDIPVVKIRAKSIV
jgi:hypothetical protein